MRREPTVYVVDDDSAVRESLQWLLESVDLHVETYCSAHEFLDAYRPADPGCLILDVRMPGMSGLELQKALGDHDWTLPVIVITGHGDVPMAVRAMKSGAVDFIQKPFNDQTLLERIHQCLAQDRDWRARLSEQAALRSRVATLTPRERQVLEGVVGGRLNKVIADDLGISNKTVEAHRASIMEKMVARSLAELVTMCVSCGISKGNP
ncbi:MAG: response regulator transcription factor [Pseudomonadota bacterium]|nr:MAG: response regulator transcription factor [Pseudomonadota bacterium]